MREELKEESAHRRQEYREQVNGEELIQPDDDGNPEDDEIWEDVEDLIPCEDSDMRD